MAELKTKKNNASVVGFIAKIQEPQKRADAKALLALMRRATGEKPAMWGSSIVGFGSYHYESERSSQKGEWPLVGFSPRVQNLTLYIMPGFKEHQALLKKLGKHTTSVGCLYIKRLADVDLKVLEQLVKRAYLDMQKRYAGKQ